MYSVDCFDDFFVDSKSERCWVDEDCWCFSVFFTFYNDVVDREVFLAYITHCGGIFRNKEGVVLPMLFYSMNFFTPWIDGIDSCFNKNNNQSYKYKLLDKTIKNNKRKVIN